MPNFPALVNGNRLTWDQILKIEHHRAWVETLDRQITGIEAEGTMNFSLRALSWEFTVSSEDLLTLLRSRRESHLRALRAFGVEVDNRPTYEVAL